MVKGCKHSIVKREIVVFVSKMAIKSPKIRLFSISKYFLNIYFIFARIERLLSQCLCPLSADCGNAIKFWNTYRLIIKVKKIGMYVYSKWEDTNTVKTNDWWKKGEKVMKGIITVHETHHSNHFLINTALHISLI